MITGVRWFTGRTCIGIVQIVEDHEKEDYRQTGTANFKYYIDVVAGRDPDEDAHHIADFGAIFDKVAGDALFNVANY